MPTAKGLESLRYWERLARGKFLSNERRQDQYRILYCWNVVRGLIPNCGITVDSTRESRRGSPRLSPQSQGPGKPSSPSWWRDPGYSTAFPGPWGTWTASLEPQRLTWIPTWKPSLLQLPAWSHRLLRAGLATQSGTGAKNCELTCITITWSFQPLDGQ